jgi:hypothetical protein
MNNNPDHTIILKDIIESLHHLSGNLVIGGVVMSSACGETDDTIIIGDEIPFNTIRVKIEEGDMKILYYRYHTVRFDEQIITIPLSDPECKRKIIRAIRDRLKHQQEYG